MPIQSVQILASLLVASTAVTAQPAGPLDHGADGIKGYACYRTLAATEATGQRLAADHPTLAQWIDIGDTWARTRDPASGHDIYSLIITNRDIPGPKPPVVMFGALHAREYAPAELLTRFAEWLVSAHGTDAEATALVDQHEIHLVLQANPDGRAKAETGLPWRKNINNTVCTDKDDRGVDLNRNFAFQWGCCGGSGRGECSFRFRGSGPASEPETQHLQAYLTRTFADQRDDALPSPAPADTVGVFVDVHSFAEAILASYGFRKFPPPNGPQILRLSRKWGYLNAYPPKLGNLGIVDGSAQDFAYGTLGVAAYTLELGTAFFEPCDYFEANIAPRNYPVLIHAIKAARAPYQLGGGPDVTGLPPALSPVIAGASAQVTGFADDGRSFAGEGRPEPAQSIQQVVATIGQPPWHDDAQPARLLPDDGAYDASREAFSGALDSTGLPVGRHIVYVQAQDASGERGVYSATYLDVLDAQQSARITGLVRRAGTEQPVPGAHLAIGPYRMETAANGQFELIIPAGEYTVTVSAPGFVSPDPQVVTMQAGDLRSLPLDLRSRTVHVRMDGESAPRGWTAMEGWALTSEKAASGARAWSDSPNDDYTDGSNARLTSPRIDLTGVSEPVLSFRHQHEIESNIDFAFVEFSTNGGRNWQVATRLSGSTAPVGEWQVVDLPLPQLSNKPAARLRFRLKSGPWGRRDGWYIDDIELWSAAP